jgi:PHS family inorganic phosphate transporter-like MFS transporter
MGKGQAGVDSGSLLGPALGNLHGQYNFQSIAIAMVVMKEKYPQTKLEQSLLLCVVFAGAVFGQLIFGYIGDWVGRNRATFLTNFFCVLGAAGSAIFTGGNTHLLYISICIWRFILGMGVGGVYPLSATSAAEDTGSSSPLERRKRVSWAFFWQVPGSTLPFFVAFVLARLFPGSVDLQWRLTLGLGAIPAALVMWHSMNREESKEFQAAKQEVSLKNALRRTEYWTKLVGTGGGWFCYDIVHYGPYLIAPVIIANIFNTEDQPENVDTVAWQTSFANMIGVPGVLTCIALYKYLGTKKQQWIGFLFIAVSFLLMAGLYGLVSDVFLFFLFCVMTFGINSGPSVTTFVLPSETFPPEVRSTFNGLSAAMGKTGATLITFLDYWIYEAFGLKANLYIYAVIGVFGAIITLFFVEDIDSDTIRATRSKLKEEKAIAKVAKHTEYV